MAAGRVLVVDDDPAVRELLTQAFTRKGWEVAAVGSVGQAAADLVEHPTDAVILDAELPDERGVDAVEQVLRHTDAKVVVLTGHDDEALRAGSLAAGAAAFGVKPLPLDRLFKLVQQATSG